MSVSDRRSAVSSPAQPAETTEQDLGLVSGVIFLGQRADLVGGECSGLGLAVLHGARLIRAGLASRISSSIRT